MQARTATCFKGFFLRFVTWFTKKGWGQYPDLEGIPLELVQVSYHASKNSVNAHSSQRDSFSLVPIIMCFVFS